ncbi:MAG TPA: hypothetical protein VFQ76_09950 [Longimicrobiaceae bacterium]|nr:hypothetical protein [Longimicrobiaceae bacterium]
MKHARPLFALILVVAAVACSDEPTGPLPGSPRSSGAYLGSGNDTKPDSTTQAADTTKQQS